MSQNFKPVVNGISREEDLRRYDALPSELKRIYQRAPIELGTMAPEKMKPYGRGAKGMLIAKLADYGRKQCAKTYGKEHPCHDRLEQAYQHGKRLYEQAMMAGAPSLARGAR